MDHFGPSALTIGNFDGVHAGHREILRRVVELARQRGWKPSVLAFDPHPARIVAPERAPRLLTTPEERALLMREEGIEQVLILPFTRELAGFTPERFVREIVVERLEARAVLVGDSFRFGHEHAGDTRLLAELGRRHGFLVEAVPAIRLRGRAVSSSEVRRLIQEGNVALAARLLARPYALAGEVVAGQGIGSKQTVPTLNLAPAADVRRRLGDGRDLPARSARRGEPARDPRRVPETPARGAPVRRRRRPQAANPARRRPGADLLPKAVPPPCTRARSLTVADSVSAQQRPCVPTRSDRSPKLPRTLRRRGWTPELWPPCPAATPRWISGSR